MPVCPNCHEQNPRLGAACPRCAGYHYVLDEALEDAATDPQIGRLAADKFVVLGLISEGGMGAVYRALQLPVEREVAFKVLRTELKDSDQGRDRFEVEAKAISRLNHPNIITMFDFGVENDKHPYMVMEYAPGKSLAKWLRTEALTVERILHVTAQILSALAEAHNQGVVHRDLKPENMIVSPKGNDNDFIKLLDFGIARMINEGATRGLTREGEVFGTPHYMAPEQAQGRKDIGPSADVYSVGVMMFEMLTGECPFDAPTPLAVLFMHINDPLPEIIPRPGLGQLSPHVVSVVQRATAKNPLDRFQTAGEMLNALAAVVPGYQTGAVAAVPTMDPSQEIALDATVAPGTLPPGLTATRQGMGTPIPERVPQMTPAQLYPPAEIPRAGFGTNPAIAFDPDPSVVAPPGSQVYEIAQDYGTPVAQQDDSLKKLGLVAAALIVLVLVGIVAIVTLTSGTDDASAENVDGQDTVVPNNPEQPGETEIAIKENPPPVEEPPSEEPEVVEPATEQDAGGKAVEPEVEEPPTEEPVEKPAVKKTTKKTTKKATKEPPPTEEKPVEKPPAKKPKQEKKVIKKTWAPKATVWGSKSE